VGLKPEGKSGNRHHLFAKNETRQGRNIVRNNNRESLCFLTPGNPAMAAISLRCTAPNFSIAIEHASVSNRKPSFDNFGSSFETNAGRLAQHRCSAPFFRTLAVRTSSDRGRSVSGPLSNELMPISRDSRLSGHSTLSTSSHSNVGRNMQQRGVRTQAQSQREREEEGQQADEKSKTERNLVKELRETRGVEEAAKVGADAMKAEAEKDLSWYRSLKKPWFSPPVSPCMHS
jgi:hypothetical protein